MSTEFKPTPAVRDEVMKACGRTTQIQPYQYLTGQIPSTPVPVKLEFTFSVEELPKNIALVVEKPEDITIFVNGQPARLRAADQAGTDLAYAWLGDPGFGAFDIRSLVRKGDNSITLDFTASAETTDVEEVYLLGDFGVWNHNGKYVVGKEPETLAAGSWVDQGYPFYSGTMRYHLTFDGTYRWLDLSDSAGSLLRLTVNGGQAQVLPWRPWVVDVSDSLKPGTNKIEVDVVSSLNNSFGPLHHKNGDLKSASPADFRVNPNFWTDEYHFATYGLLGPVRLG
jgi:hypothetical protein